MDRDSENTPHSVSLLVREAVEAILGRVQPKPSRIVLFGSEARGDAAADSEPVSFSLNRSEKVREMR